MYFEDYVLDICASVAKQLLAFTHLLHTGFSFQKVLSDSKTQMQLPTHNYLENNILQVQLIYIAYPCRFAGFRRK